MSALTPILEDLRARLAAAGDDLRKRNDIVMAVAEAATQLDVELEKTVAGMAT